MAHGDGSGGARQRSGGDSVHAARSAGTEGAPTRRQLLQRAGAAAVVGGPLLVVGWWLTLGARAAVPAGPDTVRWLVGSADALAGDSSTRFITPAGRELIIHPSRPGSGAGLSAMSTTCPHLGCQVRWQPGRGRYECPCHAATFDEHGEPLSGPPLEAGQRLVHYPAVVRDGRLYVELPPAELGVARVSQARPPAPQSGGGQR